MSAQDILYDIKKQTLFRNESDLWYKKKKKERNEETHLYSVPKCSFSMFWHILFPDILLKKLKVEICWSDENFR